MLLCSDISDSFLQDVSSPLSLLLQQVGEIVAFVHEVNVFALFTVQFCDGAPVALLCQQQLL